MPDKQTLSAPETVLVNRTDGRISIDLQAEGSKIASLPVTVTRHDGQPFHNNTWIDAVNIDVAEDGLSVTVSIPDDLNTVLSIDGFVNGMAICPCTPNIPAGKLPVVRAVSGRSRNNLNTGIYCLYNDWAFEITKADYITIMPAESPDSGCRVSAKGTTVRIALTPGFFRNCRNLPYFAPKTFTLPRKVPCGWISWYAYHVKISEEHIRHVADWAQTNLRDYGLEYIIIDDGWFGGSRRSLFNVPHDVNWTTDNGQFPSGMKATADYLHNRGFKAGIWISPWGCSGKELDDHPDWWVRAGTGGEIVKGTWHGFAFMDASNPEAVDKWLLKGILAQKANGFDYFKFDGMMHVAYDAYRKTNGFFTDKGTTWQEAFREGWRRLKEAAGNSYVALATRWDGRERSQNDRLETNAGIRGASCIRSMYVPRGYNTLIHLYLPVLRESRLLWSVAGHPGSWV